MLAEKGLPGRSWMLERDIGLSEVALHEPGVVCCRSAGRLCLQADGQQQGWASLCPGDPLPTVLHLLLSIKVYVSLHIVPQLSGATCLRSSASVYSCYSQQPGLASTDTCCKLSANREQKGQKLLDTCCIELMHITCGRICHKIGLHLCWLGQNSAGAGAGVCNSTSCF